jgi:hypothetical protein
MQRRGDDSIASRINRLRQRGRSAPPRAPVRKRRVPRREIEARRTRMIRWGVAVAGLAVVVLLAGGILYDRVIKPNQTLATVDGVNISRQDYWMARANDLYEQALQYQSFAQFVGPDQQGQYQALAQQSMSQIPTIWGGTDVDPATLNKMIEDQVYLQGLKDLGLSLTPEEIHTYALNRFAPPNAPLIPPSPTPTLTAARAAMATSTAQALLGTPLASPFAATPVAATPFLPAAATPLGTPLPATPAATPLAAVPTTAPATPNPTEARATAEAGFSQFEQQFFGMAHLSQADYDRLVAAPALARTKVQDALSATVGQSAPQVRARHILLPTREAAESARNRITAGEDFAKVAREVSSDSSTAGNGGELGWFAGEEMAAPFADAAFALKPGEISQPVQTEYGWHIIQTEQTDPDRPLTDAQITRIEQNMTERWVEAERQKLGTSSTIAPTPTPTARTFQPPPGAPPPPTPTPLPATPAATPVRIPIATTPVG